MKSQIFSVALFAVLPTVMVAHQDVLGIHGSGTTNPSKCYWDIMEQMVASIKHPTHLTYRAIGSSMGIRELVNDNKPEPLMDFSSGDIPVPTETWNGLKNAGIEVAHFPVLLGAVSFFHNVPLSGDNHIKLDSCLLARIFNRDITMWNHPDIVAINEHLRNTARPITVVHRQLGSSSTASVTQYFQEACTSYDFPQAGTTITWPEDTLGCQGSGGVTQCIRDNVGAIGYIDAGHGILEGLPEIHLRNRNGKYITAQFAIDNNGIDAADNVFLPVDITKNFGDIDLLNLDGEFTWPLILMTYIYVRKDLTFIEDPRERALLVAFLRAMYDPLYVSACQDKYGFILPNPDVRQAYGNAISELIVSAVDDTEMYVDFIFEVDTLVDGSGTNELVISQKRKLISDLERDDLIQDNVLLQAKVASLEAEVSQSNAEVVILKSQVQEVAADLGIDLEDVNHWTESKDQQLKASLVLSSLSFVMCMFIVAFSVVRWIRKP